MLFLKDKIIKKFQVKPKCKTTRHGKTTKKHMQTNFYTIKTQVNTLHHCDTGTCRSKKIAGYL
jgi:hypothetical protein